MATVRSAAQVISTIRPGADGAATLVVFAQLPALPTAARPASSFENGIAQRPAKYLLFQVFRI